MNKKKYIGIFTLSLILVVLLYSSSNHTIELNKNLKIFVTNDIHFIANSLSDNSEGFKKFANPTDGKQLLYIDNIVDAFIDEIHKEKPDILIISGDLSCNGARESHLELAKKLKKIERLGTKVYVIPGNHDIKNIWARGYKDGKQYTANSIDQSEFEKIYRDFGYKEAILRQANSLNYLTAPTDDLWLLMIDTNEYIEGEGMPTGKGIITDDALEWIKECGELANEKGAKIIPVMHHNLLKHHESSSERSRVDCYQEAVQAFKAYGFDLSLTGHIHVQDIACCDKDEISIYEISTSALIMYPHQYGIIEFTPDESIKYKTQKLDIDTWAVRKKIDDENLLNFSQYSKDTCFELNYYRAFGELIYEDGLSEDDADKVANLVANIMLRYYEGTINSIRDDIINCPEYRVILDTQSEILYDLIYSIMLRGKDISTCLEILY